MDPSPFKAQELDAQAVVEEAIHHYFAYRVELNQREFRHLMQDGTPEDPQETQPHACRGASAGVMHGPNCLIIQETVTFRENVVPLHPDEN